MTATIEQLPGGTKRTTRQHRRDDREFITERIIESVTDPKDLDLPGYMDWCMLRLAGFHRGWPAADFLRGLAAAVKAGEREALAEVGHAKSLGEVERWQVGQVLRLWRQSAPPPAQDRLRMVWREWTGRFGEPDAVPPAGPVDGGVVAGPQMTDPIGREFSPSAPEWAKPKRRR